MSRNEPLNAELETQAQELAARIRARADEDILALARLLVSKNDAEVFGDTEFEARTIVHHVGAVALEERLKKAWLRRQAVVIADPVNLHNIWVLQSRRRLGQTICLKCLQKEPRPRYQSADALSEEVQRFLEGCPSVPDPWAKRLA
jgi:hypothetical protein